MAGAARASVGEEVAAASGGGTEARRGGADGEWAWPSQTARARPRRAGRGGGWDQQGPSGACAGGVRSGQSSVVRARPRAMRGEGEASERGRPGSSAAEGEGEAMQQQAGGEARCGRAEARTRSARRGKRRGKGERGRERRGSGAGGWPERAQQRIAGSREGSGCRLRRRGAWLEQQGHGLGRGEGGPRPQPGGPTASVAGKATTQSNSGSSAQGEATGTASKAGREREAGVGLTMGCLSPYGVYLCERKHKPQFWWNLLLADLTVLQCGTSLSCVEELINKHCYHAVNAR
nr:spidroin-1-like [Aegilops tauschii subsp. strangulata]